MPEITIAEENLANHSSKISDVTECKIALANLRQCLLNNNVNTLTDIEQINYIILSQAQILSSAIYLPLEDKGSNILKCVASAGSDISIELNQTIFETLNEFNQHIEATDIENNNSKLIYSAINLAKSKPGLLVVRLQGDRFDGIEDLLNEAILTTQILTERYFVTRELEYLKDRIAVLNEVNQLIATKAPLERIARMIVRESAFRFSADCALVYLREQDSTELKLGAVFGPNNLEIPEFIQVNEGLVGKAIQLDGILSVPEISGKTDIGLDYLANNGITSVTCCSLTVKGESLGAVILGYRNETWLRQQQSLMFEEFAKAAAAALANARSRSQIKSYTDKLEELVQDRTADLAIQTAKAEEANKAKSSFVANISHELRTPLTGIIGYASVLAEGVFGELNQKQREALESITKSSEHLHDLINDVLNISRIQSGKEDARPEKIELFPLIEQIFKLMIQTAMGKNLQLVPLDINADVKVAKLWIDARHIRQILINLVSNAIKYTEPGGQVKISAELIADKAKISITDTGVGISPRLKETLFERFERGDDSYSRKQLGTGLGLSLTKHLINLNGGTIGVESNGDQGSTFWVMVPLADTEAHAIETAKVETEDFNISLEGLNVLVVDDNVMNCKLLEMIINKAGGSAQTAYNVAEAKKVAHLHTFDAALIDLAMPGESGIDLIEYFKNECDESLNNIPLIVVSACAFEKDQTEAKNAGACHFIAKPFRPKEIVQTVRHYTSQNALGELD